MASNKSLGDLSPELLTEIFVRLPLKDRKNVRLTCTLFYDACNRIPIIQREKFVLRSGFCIQEITKTLISCEYKQLNLEFQGLPVDMFPAAIWKNCNERIRSLVLYQCTLSHKAVKNIITQCTNLQRWKIWMKPEDDFLYCRSAIFFNSSKSFDDLIKNRVVRKNLNAFELFINTESGFWNSVIKKVFTIFPNIKVFKANCWCSHGLINVLELYPSFLCSRIDKCLNLALLETLTFDLPTDGRWFKNMVGLPALRLKKIQTSFLHAGTILEPIFDFFSKQQELEIVNLTLSGINERSLRKLIFHILRECARLRELRLSYPLQYCLIFNMEEFGAVLKSNLQSLQIRFNVELVNTVTSPFRLPINQNLQCLVIDSHHDESERDCTEVLKHFSNLKHLELCFVTNKVLQTIFEYQTKLVKLVLSHIDFCTDYGFTGRTPNETESEESQFSIRRLQNLECLEVNGWCSFTEITLYEFVFPRLKHFRLALGFENEGLKTDPLLFIARSAPLLEVVTLDLEELSQKVLIELGASLKKLYFLDLGETEVPNLNCAALFHRCSLRFVLYNGEIFCYNPFTNKVSFKSEDCLEIKKSNCCCRYVHDEL